MELWLYQGGMSARCVPKQHKSIFVGMLDGELVAMAIIKVKPSCCYGALLQQTQIVTTFLPRRYPGGGVHIFQKMDISFASSTWSTQYSQRYAALTRFAGRSSGTSAAAASAAVAAAGTSTGLAMATKRCFERKRVCSLTSSQ